MKKIFLAGLFVVVLSFNGVALARSINVGGGTLACETAVFTDSTGATSTMSTDLCNAGNGDPMLVMQAWGLDGYHTPIVASGTTVVDDAGFSGECPWFYSTGCFDLTHTAYYEDSMRQAAHDVVARDLPLGRFTYWLSH